MTLFKILWGIDGLAALVVLYFFFTGMADGSVSDRNILLWLMILCVLAAVLLGSIGLRLHFPTVATALLSIIALPAVGYLLFILLAVFSKGKWN